jgi:hypothetical protein
MLHCGFGCFLILKPAYGVIIRTPRVRRMAPSSAKEREAFTSGHGNTRECLRKCQAPIFVIATSTLHRCREAVHVR